MLWIVIKYLTTAAIVVLVSEVAKRSDKMGGFGRSFTDSNHIGVSLDVHRRAGKQQTFKSCFLYFLVCVANITNVFVLSLFTG